MNTPRKIINDFTTMIQVASAKPDLWPAAGSFGPRLGIGVSTTFARVAGAASGGTSRL